MKRVAGMVMVLLTFLAQSVQGQEPGGLRDGREQSPSTNSPEWRWRLSADQLIRHRRKLNLTDDQINRIKATQGTRREVADRERVHKRELRDGIRDGEITLNELRAKIRDLQDLVREGRLAHRQELDAILSEVQKERFRELRGQTSRRRRVRSENADRLRSSIRLRPEVRGSRSLRGGRTGYFPLRGQAVRERPVGPRSFRRAMRDRRSKRGFRLGHRIP